MYRVDRLHPNHMSGSQNKSFLFIVKNNAGAACHLAFKNNFALKFGTLKKSGFLFNE